jgi:putative phage-type endonuclease
MRLGKVTASRVADVIAKTKTGWGASRANYMAELLAERLTGSPAERYSNAAMQWGTDNEPAARDLYAKRYGFTVAEIAFVDHPLISMTGASPDGLIGTDGLVEIKAPNTSTHIDTLLGAKVPEKYITQMQWQMACTRRQWCDFVSYDPRLPEEMQLFVQRVDFNSDLVAQLENLVEEFLNELAAKETALRNTYQTKAAA